MFDDLFTKYPCLLKCEASIRAAYESLEVTYESGNKVLICGNGGSSSDSEHMVGELMKSFEKRRPLSTEFTNDYLQANGELPSVNLSGALPAISLSSQTSLLTAVGNDCGYEVGFAQQVLGYGKPGDAFIGFSTSGNSRNVVEAARVAKALHMTTIAITGASVSMISKTCDIVIQIPKQETAQIQEFTLPVCHALCRALETHFWS